MIVHPALQRPRLRYSARDPPWTPAVVRAAQAALAGEVTPIDDIRSTARYRSAVAANLLAEFLQTLQLSAG